MKWKIWWYVGDIELAFASKSKGADWFTEADGFLSSNSDKIPPSFYHYRWLSEIAKGKKVLELDCRAGLGAMIISDAAAKCTGMDANLEAIKYAMRNCYVDGKTKFVVAGGAAADYSAYDFIVSFNNDSISPIEFLKQFISSHSATSSYSPANPTLLLGVDASQDSVSAVKKLAAPASTPTFYLQPAKQPESLVELSNDKEITEAIRVIAAINFHPGMVEPVVSNPRLDSELVSIVIPTYNRADLISESIDSALNQTCQNCEIIVVDDGSTDETEQVVAKYGSKVRYYRKKNGGIGSALNYGISQMTGRWFKWLSSDDVLTPDAVEQLVAHANETGALITYTDYDIIDDDGKFIEKFVERHYGSYYEYASALWTRYIGNGSSVLIEKSCFDDVGLFNESLRSAEDYDWWLRACLLHGYRFYHLPRPTLRYRTHGKQLTTAVKHNAYVTAEKIRADVKQRIISADPLWWETLEYYQKLYAKENQKGGIARRLLRKSLVHMPEGMRKSALKTWQESVKPHIESDNN